MPRRLVIPALVCLVCGLLLGHPGRAVAKPLLPGSIASPARFVPPAPPPPTLAERAVTLARSQLGVPYVYGGASPAGFAPDSPLTTARGVRPPMDTATAAPARQTMDVIRKIARYSVSSASRTAPR